MIININDTVYKKYLRLCMHIRGVLTDKQVTTAFVRSVYSRRINERCSTHRSAYISYR